MKLSHSKLHCILECPMTYYLKYHQGIKSKSKKPALTIGSAVHWGIEHNTEDLTEFFETEGGFKKTDNYTKEQMLAEAMVHGYFKHKDEIFQELLKDNETGEKLELVEELHELNLEAKLKSFKENVEHDFIGIIDLLLLTNKGFILVDYKTSSQTPDWDNYLDQLYRYIYQLKVNFPEVPVLKICIINLRKTNIRQKKNENDIEFSKRLRFEYEINDEDYINHHEYLPEELDENLINNYIENLSKMADMADMIDKQKMWFINFKAAKGQYGRSDYYDIFYKTEGAEVLYEIKDYVWNDITEEFEDYRDCLALDMKVIDKDNVLNKYEIFKENLLSTSCMSKEEFYNELSENYIVDRNLLDQYWKTFGKEKEVMKNAGQ